MGGKHIGWSRLTISVAFLSALICTLVTWPDGLVEQRSWDQYVRDIPATKEEMEGMKVAWEETGRPLILNKQLYETISSMPYKESGSNLTQFQRRLHGAPGDKPKSLAEQTAIEIGLEKLKKARVLGGVVGFPSYESRKHVSYWPGISLLMRSFLVAAAVFALSAIVDWIRAGFNMHGPPREGQP